MIRTQIQLTETQYTILKQLTACEDRSVADLIREALEALLIASAPMDCRERCAHALAANGKFGGAGPDLAENPDPCLEHMYGA